MTTHYNASGSVDKWDKSEGKRIAYQYSNVDKANKAYRVRTAIFAVIFFAFTCGLMIVIAGAIAH